MPVQRDHYELLGVTPTAGAEEIHRAFRRLALKYHPDNYQGNKAKAARLFNRIVEAHEVLSDPAARGRYDRERALRAASPAVRAPPARPDRDFRNPPPVTLGAQGSPSPVSRRSAALSRQREKALASFVLPILPLLYVTLFSAIATDLERHSESPSKALKSLWTVSAILSLCGLVPGGAPILAIWLGLSAGRGLMKRASQERTWCAVAFGGVCMGILEVALLIVAALSYREAEVPYGSAGLDICLISSILVGLAILGLAFSRKV